MRYMEEPELILAGEKLGREIREQTSNDGTVVVYWAYPANRPLQAFARSAMVTKPAKMLDSLAEMVFPDGALRNQWERAITDHPLLESDVLGEILVDLGFNADQITRDLAIGESVQGPLRMFLPGVADPVEFRRFTRADLARTRNANSERMMDTMFVICADCAKPSDIAAWLGEKPGHAISLYAALAREQVVGGGGFRASKKFIPSGTMTPKP